jgi:hypothetical protein
MINHYAFPATDPCPRLVAGLRCRVLASGLKALLRLSVVRSMIPLAVFAMAMVSAQAATVTLTYTDNQSDSASLVLTGIIATDGGFDVTGVTGSFNGSPVTGPVSDRYFGTTSNEFYSNPSMVMYPTTDTGFVFETAGGAAIVDLYEYNDIYGAGFATSLLDPSPYSGGVTITGISFSSGAPEPATGALGFGALLLIAGWRKFAMRRG